MGNAKQKQNLVSQDAKTTQPLSLAKTTSPRNPGAPLERSAAREPASWLVNPGVSTPPQQLFVLVIVKEQLLAEVVKLAVRENVRPPTYALLAKPSRASVRRVRMVKQLANRTALDGEPARDALRGSKKAQFVHPTETNAQQALFVSPSAPTKNLQKLTGVTNPARMETIARRVRSVPAQEEEASNTYVYSPNAGPITNVPPLGTFVKTLPVQSVVIGASHPQRRIQVAWF